MHVGIFGTGLTDSSERFLKKILDENNITSSKLEQNQRIKKLIVSLYLVVTKALGIIFIEHLTLHFQYWE